MLCNYLLKRIFDFTVALIGIFVSLPLWIIFGSIIWLKDKGAIFYIQDRVGLNGKIFKMIKFRTMNNSNEKNSNFTKFLRTTALDELPQLINILKGEMSFVGPRPLVPEEVSQDREISSRFIVRPGLTGMAQILVPKDASLLEKSNYDLWYIKNQSFRLDATLILKSFWISLSRKWDIISKNLKEKRI